MAIFATLLNGVTFPEARLNTPNLLLSMHSNKTLIKSSIYIWSLLSSPFPKRKISLFFLAKLINLFGP